MTEAFLGLFNLRDKLPPDPNHKYVFTTFQGYLVGILFAFVAVLAYLLLVENARYSTLLTLGALVFVFTLAIIDFPDRRWFQVILYVGIALLIFEIVGYEFLRILRQQNFTVNVRKLVDNND